MAGLIYRTVVRHKVAVAIVLFLCAFSWIHFMWKPTMIYREDGSFREFGVGFRQKTVIPAWVCAIVLGIFSYLAVNYYILYG